MRGVVLAGLIGLGVLVALWVQGRMLWRVVRAVMVVFGAVVLYVAVTFGQVWWSSRQDERPRSAAIVVLGAAREASAAGLVGTTRRLGMPVVAVESPEDPDLDRAWGFRRIVLTAGAFVPEESVFLCKKRLEEGG